MKQPITDRDAPWRDRETLEELYVEKRMTQAEIGERFDVDQRTISRWLERHDVTHKWEDEDTMRGLYEERMLTIPEVAEELNCTPKTVDTWLKRHGIETRSRVEEMTRVLRKQPPKQHTTREGYEVFYTADQGIRKAVRVHRLIAAAEYGLDAVAGKVVHHRNGIPWDNRPSNLDVMSAEEHGRTHQPVQVRHGNMTPREQHQVE